MRATAPAWSAAPERVSYRWQRCAAACAAIPGASSLSLRLTRLEAGRAVRLVATATIGGDEVTTVSARLPIPRR